MSITVENTIVVKTSNGTNLALTKDEAESLYTALGKVLNKSTIAPSIYNQDYFRQNPAYTLDVYHNGGNVGKITKSVDTRVWERDGITMSVKNS